MINTIEVRSSFSVIEFLKNTAFILLLFLCLTHLLVLLVYLTGNAWLPFAFPLALILTIGIHFTIKGRWNYKKKESLWAVATSLMIISLSLLFSFFYYDLSWDGQWYHQAAIYHLESGWNPLLNPIEKFDKNNDLSIIHFPKGSWYYAAAVLSTFGNPEAGKSINWITLFAAICMLYATLREFGFSNRKCLLVTGLIALNPVVWSEITTYLVDGLLFLFLVIYATALFDCIRKPGITSLLIGGLATICLINTKFTGLVFFCVFAFFGTVYIVKWKKSYFKKFILAHLIVTIVGVLLFGYNPYVTNFVKRGHPFYPIMGTKTYPSVFELTCKDSNEEYETPQNMMGKDYATRLFYATFGRPGNAPYNKEEGAELIWPFTSKAKDWKVYYSHETRVSGFGPWFGGILILSMAAMIYIFFIDKKLRWVLLLCTATIIACLLFSKHFWWPRLVPQTWFLALLPAIFLFHQRTTAKIKKFAFALSILIAVNGFIVLFAHMAWETRSSIALRNELSELQLSNKPIEIDYGWFKKSMQEKLNRRGIRYTSVKGKLIKQTVYKTLTSVVEGYPNMVIYREGK